MIYFSQGDRWRGWLDNPAINGLSQFFNPVGNILASTENVRLIGNELDRIATIQRQQSEVAAMTTRTLDSMIERVQQRNQSQETRSWLETATVVQLRAELLDQQAWLSTRQSFLTWLETERSKWWWDRTLNIADIDRDLPRVRLELEQYQAQIVRINGELARRGATTS